MSTFECPVVRVTDVKHHPNADRLDLVYFRGFAVVTAKLEDGSPRYKVGDLVVYVPTDSILPEYLLRQGFWNDEKGHGMLDGPNFDRVKPRTLRKVLSEGIMFPVYSEPSLGTRLYWVLGKDNTPKYVEEGSDVAEFLGIKKYEPPIPTGTEGVYIRLGGTIRIPRFDVENLKLYPDVLDPEEEVTVTEKLHGTCFGFGYIPCLNHPDLISGETFAFSKITGGKGLIFKERDFTGLARLAFAVARPLGLADWLTSKEWGWLREPVNQRNLYVQFKNKLAPRLNMNPDLKSIFVFGELFGRGVQDLHYGLQNPAFRLYAAHWDGKWMDRGDLESLARMLKVETTPLIWRGLWKDYDPRLASGKTTFNDKHAREGVVITPVIPRRADFGWIWLKDINEKYLTRKGGTEYT